MNVNRLQVRHVLAFADRHDASAVQAVFMREAAAPATAQVRVPAVEGLTGNTAGTNFVGISFVCCHP